MFLESLGNSRTLRPSTMTKRSTFASPCGTPGKTDKTQSPAAPAATFPVIFGVFGVFSVFVAFVVNPRPPAASRFAGASPATLGVLDGAVAPRPCGGTVAEQCRRQKPTFYGLRARALFHRSEIFFRAPLIDIVHQATRPPDAQTLLAKRE